MFRRTWQLAISNAHAYRLYVVNDPRLQIPALHLPLRLTPLRSAKPSIMTAFVESCQTPRSLPRTGLSAQSVSEDSHSSTLLALSSMLAAQRLSEALMRTPRRCRRGACIYQPDDVLLSHGNPHYHRRRGVSLSCSGWEGVGPPRYGHQA